MQDRIRTYEKFIEKASRTPNAHLANYHREMLANFQHERLIHLIITLFFSALAIISIVVVALITPLVTALDHQTWLDFLFLAPFYLLALILVVLSIAYVKHYYFLENHIEALYDYSAKLAHKG